MSRSLQALSTAASSPASLLFSLARGAGAQAHGWRPGPSARQPLAQSSSIRSSSKMSRTQRVFRAARISVQSSLEHSDPAWRYSHIKESFRAGRLFFMSCVFTGKWNLILKIICVDFSRNFGRMQRIY